jgi:two-component system, NtrC family, response regulator PilR
MKRYSILVVDDDRNILETLFLWFHNYHHCPTTSARQAYQALALLNKQSFDVVLTDNMMPGLLGVEMADIIRRQGGPSVIVMSGYYNREYRFKALAAGAKAYLRKPFVLEWLPELIQDVVDRNLYYIGGGPSAKMVGNTPR